MNGTFFDARAYLQRRVALFAGISCFFFGMLLVLDFATPAPGEPLLGSTRVAGMVAMAAPGAVWAYARMGDRPAWQCRALELAAATVMMVMFATLPLFPPIEGAGGAMVMFAPTVMGVVTLLRAAIVPSPAWLSVLLGLCWGTLLTVSSTVGWEGLVLSTPGLADHNAVLLGSGQGVRSPELGQGHPVEPWVLPLASSGFATLAFSYMAGVISHVVHGLQVKVREAMEFGQYTLEAKIGEGGMGAVYRARHRMLRRPTALKLLPPEKAGEQSITRFEREVRQTSRLTHPNTVAIFDFGRTSDGIFYYAMEYIEGISLERLVALEGALPQERAVHLLVQTAESLSEAHGVGLVHRDIKPDNIMLCERGGIPDVVKVLDFGLVKDVGAATDVTLSTTNAIKGTPLYMAPEALTDPESVDARADIYALGSVAYFLLSGRPVFTGKLMELFMHHVHSEPAPLRASGVSVDEGLESIVARCLCKRPEGRFQSAAELADALRATPLSGRWTRAHAQAWWDSRRNEIRARLSRDDAAATLTIAAAPAERCSC